MVVIDIGYIDLDEKERPYSYWCTEMDQDMLVNIGTTVFWTYIWGYKADGSHTKPVDIGFVTTRKMTLKESLLILEKVSIIYLKDQGAVPVTSQWGRVLREYLIEDVIMENGKLEFQFGT